MRPHLAEGGIEPRTPALLFLVGLFLGLRLEVNGADFLRLGLIEPELSEVDLLDFARVGRVAECADRQVAPAHRIEFRLASSADLIDAAGLREQVGGVACQVERFVSGDEWPVFDNQPHIGVVSLRVLTG